MTGRQRFAREWLWLLAALGWSLLKGLGDEHAFNSDVLVTGILWCIPAYLAIGAIRLTVWSFSEVTRNT